MVSRDTAVFRLLACRIGDVQSSSFVREGHGQASVPHVMVAAGTPLGCRGVRNLGHQTDGRQCKRRRLDRSFEELIDGLRKGAGDSSLPYRDWGLRRLLPFDSRPEWSTPRWQYRGTSAHDIDRFTECLAAQSLAPWFVQLHVRLSPPMRRHHDSATYHLDAREPPARPRCISGHMEL